MKGKVLLRIWLLILTLLGTQTLAQGQLEWLDGVSHSNRGPACASGNWQVMVMAYVGYLGTSDTSFPRVGDVSYVHAVAGLVGLPCAGDAVGFELIPPQGATPAVSTEKPVRCFLIDIQTGNKTDMTHTNQEGFACLQTPETGQFGLFYGFGSLDFGQAYEIRVTLRFNQELKGIAGPSDHQLMFGLDSRFAFLAPTAYVIVPPKTNPPPPPGPPPPPVPPPPGPPPPPGSISVSKLALSNRSIQPGDVEVPALRFKLDPAGKTVSLNGLGLEAIGNGNHALDIAQVYLYRDENSSGQIDSGEPMLASDVFTQGNGLLDLNLTQSQTLSSPTSFLLVVDFAQTFALSSVLLTLMIGSLLASRVRPAMWLLVLLLIACSSQGPSKRTYQLELTNLSLKDASGQNVSVSGLPIVGVELSSP